MLVVIKLLQQNSFTVRQHSLLSYGKGVRFCLSPLH